LKDLTSRARNGALRQHELEGGTSTITNLGMFGTEEFAAIINPPQSSILAVGAVRSEAVAQEGQVIAASVLRLTLSIDHRPVDGVTAAAWLRELVDCLEHPAQILR
jgi:pyruvate dehydrogenase E2 component (dihydrolipoamide acetyltransferase)